MDPLFRFQEILLQSVSNNFRRYLHTQINWKQRMIGIKGPRGAGKTTLLLQYLKFDLKMADNALYITADHTWFYNHSLLDIAMEWYQQGGRVLLIDEAHKYRHWSRELKNIYDGLPELQIIFSASSALDLYRGEADLSRRVITYNLPGLSFREYLSFTEGLDFDPIGLDEIRDNHRAFCHSVLKKIQPLPLFKKYLRIGYLPITTEGEKEYLPKLEQIISTIIDTDLAYISPFDKGTAVKIKKMLAVIAESVPFKPNIAALARKLALSRESVYQFLYLLVDARLLNILGPDNKGVSRLQKPDKIYLENTNLIYALQEKPESGTIRATVVLNQLCNAGFKVTEPQSGDFLVGDLLMEVGGKGKKAAQVKQMEKYLVVAEDIETGIGTQVPLWVFGFLY